MLERYLDVDGLRLHLLEWGPAEAPAVLLLHGGSAHAHWWNWFAPSIAPPLRALALDLRGHGDSQHAVPPRYELEDYVSDVAGVVEALRLPRLAVVGHSMGAIVAAAYAAEAAVPVDALVLVDARIRPAAGGRRYLEKLAQWPHPVYPSRAEAVRRFRLLPSAHDAAPDVLSHIANHGLRDLPDGRCTPKFDRAALAAAAARDVSGALKSLRCPLLFVRGAASSIVPAAVLGEVQGLVPEARLTEIEAAHHHVMLDAPAEFARVVAEFLERTVMRR